MMVFFFATLGVIDIQLIIKMIAIIVANIYNAKMKYC